MIRESRSETTRRGADPPGGSGRAFAAALCAVALLAMAGYANTLVNGLTFDDQALFSQQSVLQDPLDLSGIVGSTYWGLEDDLYRPLTLWTLAADQAMNRLAGQPSEHPVIFHVVNVLLHAAVCCCLYLWLRTLRVPAWPNLAATLLYAAHPLHTEAVAPIVGRSELLAALFGLLFLIAHRVRARAPWGLVAFFLALCSKESAVAFLPLACWTELRLPAARGERRWSAPVGSACALVAWLILRAAVIPAEKAGIPLVDNPLAYASLAERWMTAASIQFDYLRLQLFPLVLRADYSYNQIPVVSDLLDVRLVLLVLVAAGAAWLGWRLRRSHPIVVFAVVAYAGLFTLTGNFFFPIGTIMGERLAYAPSVFVCLLLGHGAWRLRLRLGRSITIALIVVLALFLIRTVERNATWRDETTQLRTLVESAPDNAKAHYLMARHRFDVDDAEGAERAARRALSILPTYAEAWYELGLALAVKGDLGGAVRAQERATEIFPAYADAWGALGTVLTESGEPARALRAFGRGLQAAPQRAELHYGRGVAYQRLGRLDEAAEDYRAAMRIDARHAAAITNLGSILAGAGRFDQAAALWRRALEADPEHATARENLEQLLRLREGGEGPRRRGPVSDGNDSESGVAGRSDPG